MKPTKKPARKLRSEGASPLDWATTEADMARDLRADIETTYRHVPLTAPVACGREYLAAVRRALAAERAVREMMEDERREP